MRKLKLLIQHENTQCWFRRSFSSPTPSLVQVLRCFCCCFAARGFPCSISLAIPGSLINKPSENKFRMPAELPFSGLGKKKLYFYVHTRIQLRNLQVESWNSPALLPSAPQLPPRHEGALGNLLLLIQGVESRLERQHVPASHAKAGPGLLARRYTCLTSSKNFQFLTFFTHFSRYSKPCFSISG